EVGSARPRGASKNERGKGERQKPPPKSSNRRSISRRRLSKGRQGDGAGVVLFSVRTGNLVGSAMAHPPMWLAIGTQLHSAGCTALRRYAAKPIQGDAKSRAGHELARSAVPRSRPGMRSSLHRVMWKVECG